MWIKTEMGAVNTNNIAEIALEEHKGTCAVVAYSGHLAATEGEIEYNRIVIKYFGENSDAAQKFLDKLLEKIGAVEISIDD